MKFTTVTVQKEPCAEMESAVSQSMYMTMD